MKRLAAWLGLINDDAYEMAEYSELEDADESAGADEATITPLPPRRGVAPAAVPDPVALAPVEPISRQRPSPLVVRAFSFSDAEQIGRRYRSGYPVVVDLSTTSSAEGKRILDFISGAVFVSGGKLEKLQSRAFLLAPAGAIVSAEERAKLMLGLSKIA
jgi:cell division inhibitor SepF